MSQLAGPRYRQDVDGLRAIAVLLVVGFHALPNWFPGGYVGVDVFFVISGYLITGIILRELAQGSFSLKHFYARRVRRIFPALLLVVAAVLLVGWWFLLPHEWTQLGKHVAAAMGFVSNVVLWRESGYFDAAAHQKLLLHLWSLGIEEQFYLALPLMLMLLWRMNCRPVWVIAAVALVSFTLNVWMLASKPVATFYLPFTRVWELLLGSLLACIQGQTEADRVTTVGPVGGTLGKHVASVFGLALIAAAGWLFDRHAAFPGWRALVPASGAALLLASGPQGVVNRGVLARRLLWSIGLISFPIYLWHWPLLSYAHILSAGVPATWLRVVLALASVPLAWCTYRWLERRVRFDPRFTGPLLIASVLMLALGLAVWSGGISSRLSNPAVMQVSAAQADWAFPPDSFSRLEHDGQRFYERRGRGPGKVVFIGDSNIEQYGPRVEYLMDDPKVASRSVVMATSSGCLPILGAADPDALDCAARLRAAIDLAMADDVDTVVVGACWFCYFLAAFETEPSVNWVIERDGARYPLRDRASIGPALDSLSDTLRRLTSRKRVFVILSMPSGGGLAPEQLLEGSRWGGFRARDAADMPLAEFQDRFGATQARIRSVAEQAGAHVIDPVATMCRADRCPLRMSGGRPVYKDGVHVRADYARHEAVFIDPLLDATR